MSKYSKSILSVFGFLVVFLLVFQLPDHAADNSHDYGSQAAIEYWVKSKLAFGTDVIQNVGPYGFVMYPSIYTGFLDGQKLIINVALTSLFAYLILNLSSGRTKVQNFVLIMLAALFAYQDAFYYVLFWMLAHSLYQKDNKFIQVILITSLALLGQAKGTFFVLSVFLIAAITAGHILKKEYRPAITKIGVYIVAFIVLWLIAGQTLVAIPKYVEAIFSFTSGYNEAMQFYEGEKTTLYGMILLSLLLIISLAKTLEKNKSEYSRGDLYFFCIIEILMLFVIWKHAYVRADGHVLTLIYYAAIVSFISIWRLEPEFKLKGISQITNNRMGLNAFKTVTTVLVLYIAYADFQSLNMISLNHHVNGKINEIAKKINAIKHPFDYADTLDKQKGIHISRMQAIKFKEMVGSEKVSYVGMLPGFMVYNDFNYMPTPSTISFTAWNETALRKDAEFFSSEKTRPKFVIFSAQTIDNRFVPQDDSLAKLELLNGYNPILYENENILFSKNESSNQYSFAKISEYGKQVGDWIDVPETNEPIWLTIDFDKSIVSRIGALLYKSPEYMFEYKTNDGQLYQEKLVPSIAGTGFLISPLISTNNELLAAKSEPEYQKYLRGESNALKKVIGFRIKCGRLENICNKNYHVEFSKVAGLGLGNIDSKMAAILYASILDFNADIISYDTKYPTRKVNWESKDVTLFHAPSKLVLRKSRGNYKLTGYYGMLPTAYESGGSSDGVLLTIKFQSIGENVDENAILFQKKLDPVKNIQDRGLKALAINLPVSAGEIILDAKVDSFKQDHFVLYSISIERQ